MEIKLPYKNQKLKIEIPDKNVLKVLDKVEIKKHYLNFEEKLLNPLEKENFFDFVNTGKLLIVVNDHTRSTPTAKVLERIYRYLEGKDITVMVACGTHRAPADDELQKILGKFYHKFKDKIMYHNTESETELYGFTQRGTKVKFDKRLSHFDKLLIITSVEPHYFAGFMGGRKSFLPGLADYETIEHNHRLCFDENAKILNLDNNPVHLDMMDGANLFPLDKVFSIQVLYSGDEIYEVFCGDLHCAFFAGVEFYKNNLCIKISEVPDVVITCAPFPSDRELYQAVKALDASVPVVKEKGRIIFVACCEKGIGNDEFFNMMKSFENPDEMIEFIKKNFKVGWQRAAKIVQYTKKAKIYLYSELDENTTKILRMEKVKDLQRLIDDILEKNPSSRFLIMPHGSQIVPVL